VREKNGTGLRSHKEEGGFRKKKTAGQGAMFKKKKLVPRKYAKNEKKVKPTFQGNEKSQGVKKKKNSPGNKDKTTNDCSCSTKKGGEKASTPENIKKE